MKAKLLVYALPALVLTIIHLVQAQQPGKVFRIGILDPSTASGSAVLWEAFRQELSKLGWIEGKNVTIEYRFAKQKQERLHELAAELVRLKVVLIVVTGTTPARIARERRDEIPWRRKLIPVVFKSARLGTGKRGHTWSRSL